MLPCQPIFPRMIANPVSWSPSPCPNLRLDPIEPEVPARLPGGPALLPRHRSAIGASANLAPRQASRPAHTPPATRRPASPAQSASRPSSPVPSASLAPRPPRSPFDHTIYFYNIHCSQLPYHSNRPSRVESIEIEAHSMPENRATRTQISLPLTSAKRRHLIRHRTIKKQHYNIAVPRRLDPPAARLAWLVLAAAVGATQPASTRGGGPRFLQPGLPKPPGTPRGPVSRSTLRALIATFQFGRFPPFA
jgi:hypothetical protein